MKRRTRPATMPTALLITPVSPDPKGGGPERRAHQWLFQLGKTHQVDVLVVGDAATATWRPRLGRLLPWWAAPDLPPPDWRPAEPARLARMLEGRSYDRVLCFRHYLAEHADMAARTVLPRLLELDVDDIESATRASIAALRRHRGHWLEAAKAANAARRYLRLERLWFPRFDRLHVCCAEDRDRVAARFPGADVAIMPNRLWHPGLTAPTPTPTDRATARRVLFVGSLGYWPNRDAARFFATQVLPRLRRRDPAWTLVVVGRGAPPAFHRHMAALAGVDMRGAVADPAPFYAQADMVIAPLHAGGGTKLKVLEALAHGRPLVATAEAVRGLDLDDGRHYLLAETADAFVAACQDLAGTPDQAQAMAMAGRDRVLRHHVYDAGWPHSTWHRPANAPSSADTDPAGAQDLATPRAVAHAQGRTHPMSPSACPPAAAAGRFTFPGTTISVNRMGYGAMQLAGPHVFGPPRDADQARAVLRQARELGVDHIDTSDFYGPHVTNQLIREALAPYPADLVLVSKIGAWRDDQGGWILERGADFLRRSVEDNLTRLGLARMAIVNLRMGGADDDIVTPMRTMRALRDEGLISHIGVSTVTAAQLAAARDIAPIVCVQNEYNLVRRGDDAMIDALAEDGIAYVPYFPLGGFTPLQSAGLEQLAAEMGTSAQRLALAWLLARSPNILLIPGTSSPAHLHDNVAAAALTLTPEQKARLDGLTALG